MPLIAITSDYVFIRHDSEDFEQAQSSLAAPDVLHAADGYRSIGGGGFATADTGCGVPLPVVYMA